MAEKRVMGPQGLNAVEELIGAYLDAPPGTVFEMYRGYEEGRPEEPVVVVKVGELVVGFTAAQARSLATAMEVVARKTAGGPLEGATAQLPDLAVALRLSAAGLAEMQSPTSTLH